MNLIFICPFSHSQKAQSGHYLCAAMEMSQTCELNFYSDEDRYISHIKYIHKSLVFLKTKVGFQYIFFSHPT